MSKRSDRAAERKAVKQAEKDLKQARTAARKAFDLKDPRFLGEAAVAATRGPVGLALFGASRGLQVVRERRAEQGEILGDLASDARMHADALREKTSALSAPSDRRKPARRLAPLWIAGLAGGAAIAGATAYFLRGPGSPAPATPTPTPTPAPKPAPKPAPTPTPADTVSGAGPGAASSPQPTNAETGEDLVIDSADPEGPADQDAAGTPAAESAAPGAAAGSAPQPSDDAPEDGTANDK